MDKERFAKRSFIVAGASGIEVSTNFLNNDYALSKVKPEATTTDHGHLELFRIEPTRAGLPAFSVRIGHDKHEEINVDLEGSKAEHVAFATQAPGYIGHKADDLKTDPRSYRLYIEVPSAGRVFSGTLTMKGLGLGVRLSSEVHADVRMDAVLIRKSEKTPRD